MNTVEIGQAVSELAEQPFDRAEFQFRAAFGNKNTTLKRLHSGVSNKSDVGGVLHINSIHIASCAPGQTLAALRASAASAFQKGRFNLASDGEPLEAAGHTHSQFGRHRWQIWAESGLTAPQHCSCDDPEIADAQSMRSAAAVCQRSTNEECSLC